MQRRKARMHACFHVPLPSQQMLERLAARKSTCWRRGGVCWRMHRGSRRLAGRHNRYPTLATSNRNNYYPGVARVRCLWRPGWRHAQQSSRKPRAEARLAQTPLPLARGLPCDRSVSPGRHKRPFPRGWIFLSHHLRWIEVRRGCTRGKSTQCAAQSRTTTFRWVRR